MQSLIKFILDHLGVEAFEQVLLPMEINNLLSAEKPTVQRLFTLPDALVQQICHHTGASVEKAEALRDKAAEAFADFIASLAAPAA
ncbi:MAG: hypothetical protein JSS72_01810 [Armatimonadetes bacterium]|nr:hypothetical protein [Armatimonadota bacterium]